MGFTWLIIAVAAGAWWKVFFIPWWERRHERAAARRALCEREGHKWGEIFPACGNPQWPTRHCERCGLQQNLKECPFCRKSLDKRTGRPVE